MSVPLAHVRSGVVVRTAHRHRQERLLLGRLLRHVDIVEESLDAVVFEDFAVENIDCGVHGGISAHFFV